MSHPIQLSSKYITKHIFIYKHRYTQHNNDKKKNLDHSHSHKNDLEARVFIQTNGKAWIFPPIKFYTFHLSQVMSIFFFTYNLYIKPPTAQIFMWACIQILLACLLVEAKKNIFKLRVVCTTHQMLDRLHIEFRYIQRMRSAQRVHVHVS